MATGVIDGVTWPVGFSSPVDGSIRTVQWLDRMTPSALIAFYVAPRFEDINLK
jgi:hypothetical protein